MARTCGWARYVYHWALRLRPHAYYERPARLGSHDAAAALTTLKQHPETAGLNAVSSGPLPQALRHLDSACRNFFAGRAQYPTVKKKRGRQAVPYASSAFRGEVKARPLTLAKMDAPLDIHWSRAFTGMPSPLPLCKDPAGRSCGSFVGEAAIPALPVGNAMLGVDVGLQDGAVLSRGEQIANPPHRRRSERRLTQAQRHLARNQMGSKNRQKARLQVAREHARSADHRLDGLHQLTTRLIRANQVSCVESLTESGFSPPQAAGL